MRIRKRFPPPPFLPPDPQLIHDSLLVAVQQQGEQDQEQQGQQSKANSQPFDPSDQLHLNHPSSANDQEPATKHAQEKPVLINKRVELGEIGVNHTRKEGIQGANSGSREVVFSVPPSSGSRYQVFGGWCGEDRAIPIKKRRGSSGKSEYDEGMPMKKEKTLMEKTMKSITNKKIVQGNDDQGPGKESSIMSKLQETDQIFNNGVDAKMNTAKRGSMIMEGSRCSRVNGRGWRCCKQTLVGYSLCEHHLGKGRLRSMISVRNRAQTKKGTQMQEKKSETMFVCNEEANNGEDDDEIRDDDFVILRRRLKKKIGVVKARSISCLLRLGQTEDGTTTEDMGDENDKNTRAGDDK